MCARTPCRASARTPRRSHRMRDRACARAQCRGRPRSAYGRHCVSCLSARALCCNFPMKRLYPALGACAFVAACATAPPPAPATAAAAAAAPAGRRRGARVPRLRRPQRRSGTPAPGDREPRRRAQGSALEPARAGQGRAGVHPRSHACESANAQARHAGGCGLLPRGGGGRAGGRAREQGCGAVPAACARPGFSRRRAAPLRAGRLRRRDGPRRASGAARSRRRPRERPRHRARAWRAKCCCR